MRKLRRSTRGATELHLLDAHPTTYNQTSMIKPKEQSTL
jgi:hypothetical protein